MSKWETEDLVLRSMGNGQYEDYRIVSADEAECRVLDLEAQLAAERGRLEWMVKHDAIVCSPGYETPAPFSVQYNSPEPKRAAGYKTKNSGHHSNWRDAIDEAMRSESGEVKGE